MHPHAASRCRWTARRQAIRRASASRSSVSRISGARGHRSDAMRSAEEADLCASVVGRPSRACDEVVRPSSGSAGDAGGAAATQGVPVAPEAN